MKRFVPYKSKDWYSLVDAGWHTVYVTRNGIACMERGSDQW
jgi:hypothetical protein